MSARRNMNIIAVLSIFGLLSASFFGAWIHSKGSIVVDGTNLLEVHIVQGMGTVIIALVTFGIMFFRKGGEKNIIMLIVCLLCIIGLALSCFSGWFLYKYDGLIATFARSFDAHEIQAISTATLTMIFLMLAIMREIRRDKNSRKDEHGYNQNQSTDNHPV